MHVLKRLRIDHWGWVFAKFTLIVWGVTYYFVTPVDAEEKLGRFLNRIVAGFTVFGALIAIIGLVISTDPNRYTRQKGYAFELLGLTMALCGPLTYLIVQVAQIPDDHVTATNATFGYALTAFILARLIVVRRALGRRG